MFLKLNENIWPSNLLIAPTINFLLYFIENLLSKNLVLKLSEPSTIISKLLIIFSKLSSLIFFLYNLSFIDGLICFILFFRASTLNLPISLILYKDCLWIFDKFTLSWSAIPKVPIPALDR